jgi:hypothetical protein
VSHASCPISQGQKRWTIGVDGTIRRCSHSETAVGTILDDGLIDLLDELLGQRPIATDSQVQCCRIIDANLVRLGKVPSGIDKPSA